MSYMSENFFVKVSNPKETRITVLESSRLTLEATKSYFHLMTLREEKAKMVDHLKAQLKGIMNLFTELENKLPNKDLLQDIDHSLTAQEQEITKKKRTSKKKSQKEEAPKKETELDKLNDSLALIEERLRSLE